MPPPKRKEKINPALVKLFRRAVGYIATLPEKGPKKPSIAEKLQFYGCFKQATEGAVVHQAAWACTASAPACHYAPRAAAHSSLTTPARTGPLASNDSIIR